MTSWIQCDFVDMQLIHFKLKDDYATDISRYATRFVHATTLYTLI